MTDKEIIKALECCISAGSCCVCGYTKMCDGTTIHQFALDLINRQQHQLENYSHNVRTMTKDVYKYLKALEEANAEIKRLKKAVDIHKGIAEDWKHEARRLNEIIG